MKNRCIIQGRNTIIVVSVSGSIDSIFVASSSQAIITYNNLFNKMRTVASHPGQRVEITTENHRGGILYFRRHFDPPSKLLDLPTSRHTLRRLRQISCLEVLEVFNETFKGVNRGFLWVFMGVNRLFTCANRRLQSSSPLGASVWIPAAMITAPVPR